MKTTTKKATRIRSQKEYVLKEGSPMTAAQIEYFVNFYKTYGKIPGNKILCNRTYTLVTCVNPWLAKQVQKYGGIYEFLTRYERTKKKQKDQYENDPLAAEVSNLETSVNCRCSNVKEEMSSASYWNTYSNVNKCKFKEEELLCEK